MTSVTSLPNITVSRANFNINKPEIQKQSLPDNQENKLKVHVKKDNVELQSFVKGAAISSVAILAGVKFASSLSPSPKVIIGATAIAIGTGVVSASLIKGKESNMEKFVAGASIAGGIIGYVAGSKVGEGINGAVAGFSAGGLVGIAAGKIMEKKSEEESK